MEKINFSDRKEKIQLKRIVKNRVKIGKHKKENNALFVNNQLKNHSCQIFSFSNESFDQSKSEDDENPQPFLIREQIFKFTGNESASNNDFLEPNDEKSLAFEIEDYKSLHDKLDFFNWGFTIKNLGLENTENPNKNTKSVYKECVEELNFDDHPLSWSDSKLVQNLPCYSTPTELKKPPITNSQESKFLDASPTYHKSNLTWSLNSLKTNNLLSNDSFSTAKNEIIIEDISQNSQLFLSDDAEDFLEKYAFKFE